MADAKFLKPDTLALHAGQHPDPVTGARAVPIYQTTSFVFRDVDHAASLFNLEVGGHIYSRISNPTVAVFEERVAALEEGSGALGVASGQAALHIAIATLMGAGGHIVASTSLYGGTRNMLGLTLPRFGIETTFVNPRDHDGFRKAIRPETRLVLGETIGNPGGEVLDIPAIADIAHAGEDPADDRQHLRLAGAVPAAHPGRRHRVPLGHQVHRRPWRGDRRRDRRIGPLRLGGFGQVPDPDRALCRLSRHRLRRGVRPARLHHARPHRGRARLRLLHGAADGVLPAAGAGDAAAAHGASRRERAQGHRLPQGPTPPSSASPRRNCRTIPTMRWPRSCCPRAAARSSASTSRAGARPAGASSSG